MILREYGWLARQRYAAVTRPVGMDAAVPRRVRVRWNPGVNVVIMSLGEMLAMLKAAGMSVIVLK